jgi:hypothetical protein
MLQSVLGYPWSILRFWRGTRGAGMIAHSKFSLSELAHVQGRYQRRLDNFIRRLSLYHKCPRTWAIERGLTL